MKVKGHGRYLAITPISTLFIGPIIVIPQGMVIVSVGRSSLTGSIPALLLFNRFVIVLKPVAFQMKHSGFTSVILKYPSLRIANAAILSLGLNGDFADADRRGYNSINVIRPISVRTMLNPSTNRTCDRDAVWLGGGGCGVDIMGALIIFGFLVFVL